MSNDAKLEAPHNRLTNARPPLSWTISPAKIMKKYNCSGDGPPVIFAAPWVGPPAVVARPTSAFKISMYHR